MQGDVTVFHGARILGSLLWLDEDALEYDLSGVASPRKETILIGARRGCGDQHKILLRCLALFVQGSTISNKSGWHFELMQFTVLAVMVLFLLLVASGHHDVL